MESHEYLLTLLELNTALVAFEYVLPEGGCFSVTTPGPNTKRSILYQVPECVSSEGGRFL